MAAVTADSIVDVVPALGSKVLRVKAPATTDDTDTIAVDLTAYGCTNIDGIVGFTESTTGSVVITEAPTTSVTTGTLTITVGGATDNKARTFIVYAY
jgi:hypothetical protein